MRFGRKSARALVVGGVAAIAVIATSAPALAFGTHAFTPQAPNWSFSDSNGSGTEQILYGTSLSEQWGYKVSATNQALATGNATETADLFCNGSLVTHYGQHIVPIDYQFHGSKGGLNTSCTYETQIHITFPVKGGTATLNAEWDWYITYV
jgi:hypothetical protein